MDSRVIDSGLPGIASGEIHKNDKVKIDRVIESRQSDDKEIADIKKLTKEEEKKEYKHEDAVMDVETVKRFLYMLGGIPYKDSKDNSDGLNRWA